MSYIYDILGRKRPRTVRRVKPIAPDRAERALVRVYQAAIEAVFGAVLADLAEAGRADVVAAVRKDGRFLDDLQVQVEADRIGRIGERVADVVEDNSRRMLGVGNQDLAAGQRVEAWADRNRALVTNLTEEARARMARVLDRLQGARVETISAELQKEMGWARKRGNLVARDQVLKLNGQLTREAHQAAGIRRYRWATSGDGSVREDHDRLNGRVFAYNDPPVIDLRTGRRGNPGEDYQCRCTAEPILDEIEPDLPTDDPEYLVKTFGPVTKRAARVFAPSTVVPTRPTAVPSRPTVPLAPTRPTVVPTRPTVPSVPTRPTVAPTRPTVPSVPTRPTVPSVPTRPTVPSAPTRPTVPLAATGPAVGSSVFGRALASDGVVVRTELGEIIVPKAGRRYRIIRERYFFTDRLVREVTVRSLA